MANDLPTGLTEPAQGRIDRWGTGLAIRPEGRDHALVRRFSLLVTQGPDAGEKYVSTGERMLIGTHPACDVVLHDSSVSRFQCEILASGKTVVIRDLDSSNGSLVDDVEVVQAALRGGAVLTLGRTLLRFEVGGEPVRIDLSPRDSFGALAGASALMRRLFAHLERAKATDAAVLLEGEPATGKTTAAEALHATGPRRGGPFLVVDCATAGPSVLGRELLHDDGAFALADGGTLFLREVGDIPIELHPRLTAAIDAHRGAVRVIAGSRRSLKAEVNARRFRSDLYQRLAGLECRIPALRERPEDLPLLVEAALSRAGAAQRPEADRLRSPEFLTELGRRAFPGNVAELFALVERAIGVGVPPLADTKSLPLRAARVAWVAESERRYLEAALAAHGGDLIGAARASGLDRIHFRNLLDRHGLR